VADLGSLTRLAAAHGIQPTWYDIWGNAHHVTETTLRALLAAMHVAAANDDQVHASLHAYEVGVWTNALPGTVVVRESGLPAQIVVRLPADGGQSLAWQLIEENGTQHGGSVDLAHLPETRRATIGERQHVARRLTLDVRPPLGYHRLRLTGDSGVLGEALFIVAPDQCYEPESLASGARAWGPAVQLYSVRSERNWGIGDFTDLQLVIEQWAERGADLVGLNPLHALFPHNPEHASPYSPSSRLFLNPLYIDPARIGGYAQFESAQDKSAAAEQQSQLATLRAAELVDYRSVAAVKMTAFDALYAGFRERALAGDSDEARSFREYRTLAGPTLRRHALFEALQAHFHREDPNVWGWPVWPEDYRHPDMPQVARFAEQHTESVEFYEWLQWHADRQLGEARRRAVELGLEVGLYGDLAVSVDRGGAEAWFSQDDYALAASVGAPPDDFSPKGQNWGLPPLIPTQLLRSGFAPLVTTLRAVMRHAGALRVDHVMQFMRLFWIPEGAGSADGAYVMYPMHEMLGILALESHRHRCIVIGEDLGTVPDEIRAALAAQRTLSYRLLYFSRQHGGEFSPPRDYPEQALVAVTTHDLPTLAGFWEGRDLALRERLGLFPSEAMQRSQFAEREHDRARVLRALDREGLLPDGTTTDAATASAMTAELARAIHVYLARTPSKLLMIQLEDVLGMGDQVNQPGTSTQYPNWRRKITLPLERWRAEPRFVELCDALVQVRPPVRPRRRVLQASSRRTAVIPSSTYRLQLHRGFTFNDATAIVPYLAELGISHVYCSPYLRARPGSTHGYDIIDHNALNPEIGTAEDFDRFVGALKAHGLGQIIDVVPNHMGVMRGDNQWWLDVLENGRVSVYAEYFDIDWEPVNPALHGKVLLPVLGDHYGIVLDRGELRLELAADTGSFSIFYHEHRFPVDPREYARILERAVLALPPADPGDPARAEFQSLVSGFAHLPGHQSLNADQIAERHRDKEVHKRRLAHLYREHEDIRAALAAAVAVFNGNVGDPRSFDPLHDLLEAQAYRLAYWRVASDEINYRRFFDINDLAALRMGIEAVFDATHALVLDLVATGKVDGLRIDHPDGLYDPAQYFRRLQDRVAARLGIDAGPEHDRDRLPFYLAIEKITAGHERVPESWPVHGTTGYRFANVVSGLFVDSTARAKIVRTYRSFVGQSEDFEEIAYTAKRLILRIALASELTVLSNQLSRIAQADRRTRDFTLNTLRGALTEIIACFPVYRTYVTDKATPQDRRFIEWAVARAKRRSRAADISIFDFVLDALLVRTADTSAQVQAFARKFQQVTAPVMAKGIEDTAFYRYNALVSLNEVGGNPSQFGFTVSAFHGASQDRAARWPHTMLATSTHDTKRSEDVRVRIGVLSELPAVWRLNLRRWSRINRSKKRKVEDAVVPSPNDEYLLYQTLLGSWPLEPLDERGLAAYCERIQAYMVKAAREAKVHTSWINVNEEYETALRDFVQALLGRADNNLFLDDFRGSQRYIAWIGMLNGLAQAAIKFASPGVPDTFQGCELWTLSLVDPDNRRPVDYALRRRLLAEMRELHGHPPETRTSRLRELMQAPEDGRCKLYVTYCGLCLRREREALFQRGGYSALAVEGEREHQLVAFARRLDSAGAILVAPRLVTTIVPQPGFVPLGAAAWGDTVILVPWLDPRARIRNVYTGREVRLRDGEHGRHLAVSDLFEDFPVALLDFEVPQ
jgi:(1->4)-alpha-D-glucan 1-alpha-D-glucosylmutase